MADAGLARKTKRRPRGRAAIIHALDGYEAASFAGLERAVSLTGTFDWIQIFVHSEAELRRLVPKAARALTPEGMLWISFPKGSSKIQTDLTRDEGWDSLKKLDLKGVSLISVNEMWSAFALRPYRPREARSRAWS
ncbi:MAG: hypothetical protein V1755_02370 [Chloroflexota bacterium]